MLYIINCGNSVDLPFVGGQTNIVHLEADLHSTVDWAEGQDQRWAFTNSNAGSYFFDDWCDLKQLGEIHWNSANAKRWSDCKEKKAAEFLLERSFSWGLVERIGVSSPQVRSRVLELLEGESSAPQVEHIPSWYY